MTATEVRPGIAEALARVAHFAAVEQAQPEELDYLALWLLGPVGDSHTKWDLWGQLRPDCLKLWPLITDDWDEDDVDELTEDEWARCSFATKQQELDHRHDLTTARLIGSIEYAIWAANYRARQQREANR